MRGAIYQHLAALSTHLSFQVFLVNRLRADKELVKRFENVVLAGLTGQSCLKCAHACSHLSRLGHFLLLVRV